MSDNATIVPNPMSDYASSSYAITLYTISRDDFKSLSKQINTVSIDNFPKDVNKKVIIAESGVTSIQINNLSINSTPLMTQGTYTTDMTMDITQPRGSNLIDLLYAISKYCGWDSPYEMNYLLEIRFLGLLDDNRNNASITTITIPIVITELNVNMSYSSTVYNVSATYSSSVINEYSYSRVPENMRIRGGSTLADFFTNFAEQLNEIEKDKVDNVNFTLPSFKHTFDLPTDGKFNFSQLKLGTPSSSDSARNNHTLYEYSSDENEVMATANSTIQSFIDNVLRYVPEIQDALVNSEQFAETFIVDPWIQPLEFDHASGKETYEIIWYIREVNRRKYSKNGTDKNTLEEKAMGLLETVKMYDYYHTGLNTELREANFDIRHLYHAKIVEYQHMDAPVSSATQLPQVRQNAPFKFLQDYENIVTGGGDDLDIGDPDSEAVEDEHGNVYLYAEDIDINSGDYYFKEPKMASMPSEDDFRFYNTGATNGLQYKEDLDYIRNATSNSFVGCKLKIKGDPYWLLPPSVAIKEGKSGYDPTKTRDYARENVALVRFNYPNNDYYDQENTPVDNQMSVFSAFYYIRSVNSTFNNGKFEQTIEGFREMQVSLSRIKQFLSEKDIT